MSEIGTVAVTDGSSLVSPGEVADLGVTEDVDAGIHPDWLKGGEGV